MECAAGSVVRSTARPLCVVAADLAERKRKEKKTVVSFSVVA